MNKERLKFKENFPDYLCVKHKIAPYTEKINYHLHSQLEMIFTLSDNLICFHERSVVKLPKYSFVLLNTMTFHYIDSKPNSGLCDRYVITFSADFIKEQLTVGMNLLGCFLNPRGECVILTPPEENIPSIILMLNSMEAATTADSGTMTDDLDFQLSTLTLKYQLCCLLSELNRIYLKKNEHNRFLRNQRYSKMVSDICTYIDQHIEKELTIEELAKHFNVSKTSLYNITHDLLEMPISDYISIVRTNKAKEYLVNTEYSIEIISQKTGYTSISSFSRFFKNSVGMSPLKYRQLMKQQLSV